MYSKLSKNGSRRELSTDFWEQIERIERTLDHDYSVGRSQSGTNSHWRFTLCA
jgi:uncharacterized alpha-E superfamily protein